MEKCKFEEVVSRRLRRILSNLPKNRKNIGSNHILLRTKENFIKVETITSLEIKIIINNQKGLTPIIIVLTAVALLTGGIFAWKYFSAPKEETELPEEERLPLLSNTAECSKSSIPTEQIIAGSFRSVDDFTSAGEATLSGYVITRDKKYFEEEIEKVYLEIAPQNGNTPQANFYSYFIYKVEEGNTVNSREDNNLLFSLGELTDNGNVFSSTASISSLAEAKILSAIKTGETISLRIQVPVWVGMGAPSNFSFACAVEFSED